MTPKLKDALDVLKSIQGYWAETADKHLALSKSAQARLTKEHHWREERYYQGRVDQIRQCLELIHDATRNEIERRVDHLRRLRVARRTAQIAEREHHALRLKLGREANPEEAEGIWEASKRQAVLETAGSGVVGLAGGDVHELFSRYDGMTVEQIMDETAKRMVAP